MIERFEGEIGRPNLIEALRSQKIVVGNAELAERIADTGVLVGINQGATIIDQGAEDTDVYLIIAGAFDIVVNVRRVARRFASDHVGEMAAIQPTQRRSATVTATILSKLTEPQLSEIARQYPDVWRFTAKELARRLE
jgi:CRP-like cAMP-binding protein